MPNAWETVTSEIKQILNYEHDMHILLDADEITTTKHGQEKGSSIAIFFLNNDIKAFTKENDVRKNVLELVEKYGSIIKLDEELKKGFDLCREKINKYEFKEIVPDNNSKHSYYELLSDIRNYPTFNLIYNSYSQDKDFIDAIKMIKHALSLGSVKQAFEISMKMKQDYINARNSELKKMNIRK